MLGQVTCLAYFVVLKFAFHMPFDVVLDFVVQFVCSVVNVKETFI